MSKQPVLTIAIPTYNRAVLLQQTLDCVFAEIEGIESIEVLVCDNASTDDTAARLIKYKADPRFSYYRSEVNHGADKNFHECILQATGHFVWRLGSDDGIVGGSLPGLLMKLKQGMNSLTGLSVNYCIIKDNSGISEKKRFTPELYSDLYFNSIAEMNFSDFSDLYFGYFPFISSTIINRELYVAEYLNYKLLGSGGYDFIGMYLLLINKYGNWAFFSDFIVICNRSSSELIGEDFKGEGFSYTFSLNYALVTIYREYMMDSYPDLYREILSKYHSRYFIGDVIKFRLSGVKAISIIKFIFSNRRKYKLDLFVLMKSSFIAFLPLKHIKNVINFTRGVLR